jgi:RNA polymerase sigma-70 factor (ECF subfamily)
MFGTVPKVRTEQQSGLDAREAETTLGDLLHGDPTKPRIREDDWARLVRAIGGGDQQALHALYERTHRLVFTLTMRLTRDAATAEELTVDVFHDVWRRAAAYDPKGGPVLGWIMNQARSRAIDRVRFDQRKKRFATELDRSPEAPPAADPQQLLDAKERDDLLRGALDVLTPAERQAIETTFFADLTYREAADRLGQPLGTVKTRIRSGLEKLRRALAKDGTGR